MYEINCFKEDSYTLTRLTQWDAGQYISIKKEDIESEMDKISNILNINKDELYLKLEFNFYNKNNNISVLPEIDKDNITVLIPDKLLQEPYPIISHIYFNSETFKRIIANIKIPVTPRPKPEDYVENSNQSLSIPQQSCISLFPDDVLVVNLSKAEFTSFDDYFKEET